MQNGQLRDFWGLIDRLSMGQIAPLIFCDDAPTTLVFVLRFLFSTDGSVS